MIKTDQGIKQAAAEMAEYYQEMGEQRGAFDKAQRAGNVKSLSAVCHDALQEERHGMGNSTAHAKFISMLKSIFSDGTEGGHEIPPPRHDHEIEDHSIALLQDQGQQESTAGWNCG